MSYPEDLEKRIEELEQKCEVSCQIKKEAFLFRRVHKVIETELKSAQEKYDILDKDLDKAKDDVDRDHVLRQLSRYDGKVTIASTLLRDINHTETDMEKYSEDELLDPDFFNF